jgi:N-acetylglutamate synthase-like GNAT family acetyltransferase
MHSLYVSLFTIRLARTDDIDVIMKIRQEASLRLKHDGVNQWQGEEPSKKTFLYDIEKTYAYVIEKDHQVVSMASLCLEFESAYETLVDKSISSMTIHRIAVSNEVLGQNITKIWFEYFEKQAKILKLSRIYIDTHADNFKMLNLLRKYQYLYVGLFEFKHLPDPQRYLFMKTILS